jgi:hypothetical protein
MTVNEAFYCHFVQLHGDQGADGLTRQAIPLYGMPRQFIALPFVPAQDVDP